MPSPLLKAFVDHIRPSVVEIRTAWSSFGEQGESIVGTGAIINTGSANGTRMCLVATAAHVLPPRIIHSALDLQPPARPRLEYRITRPLANPPRTATFTFGPHALADNFIRYHTSNPDYDAALVAFPAFCDNGSPFIDDDEKMPRMLDPRKLAGIGTGVAWTGFPGLADKLGNTRQLCYYQGTISAVLKQPTMRYLVDGSISRGVSGGPVWWANDDPTKFDYGLIGVVTSYQPEQDVPGLCVFTALNPLVAFINSMLGKPAAEEIEAKEQPPSTPTIAGSTDGEPSGAETAPP